MTTIRKAYIFRLKTNDDIESRLVRICGSARFLWNKCLAMNLDRLEKKQPILWYNELAFWLILWKRSEEYGFLRESPSQVLQQKLMDLDRAFRDAFDRSQSLKRLPVFKRKGRGDGIRFPQGFQFDNRRIFLPKIGWVGFYKSQSIRGKVKNVTVSSRAGRWYISVQVEQEVTMGPHPGRSEIGIDAGITCFAAFSDGTMVNGVHSFRRHQERLAREQRKLAHKKIHKLSTQISENQARVYVEKLQVRNMSASARGTIEVPGRGVRAKSGLNRSILDQGWYTFRRQLDYKLAWKGGELVEVDYRKTSQRCSVCGYTAKENRPTQALFRCMVCGHEENADVNAAKNVITAGRAGLVCL